MQRALPRRYTDRHGLSVDPPQLVHVIMAVAISQWSVEYQLIGENEALMDALLPTASAAAGIHTTSSVLMRWTTMARTGRYFVGHAGSGGKLLLDIRCAIVWQAAALPRSPARGSGVHAAAAAAVCAVWLRTRAIIQ